MSDTARRHGPRRAAGLFGAAIASGAWRAATAQMMGGSPMESPPFAGLHAPMLAGVALVAALAAVGLAWFFSRPADARYLPRRAAPPAAGASAAPGAEQDSFVVIPDISGYSRYMHLNRFAAGHAQFVISRLLEAVLDAGQPPLSASRVEGDSVVFFAVSEGGDPRDGVSAAAVAQAVVRIMEGFDRERAALVAKNLCPCGACRQIEELELKVIVHRGDVLRYHVGGLEDLSGIIVIEAHRLLKNTVGRSRYVLVAEPAATVALPWPQVEGGHVEHYDDVGDLNAALYLPPPRDAAPAPADVAAQARDIVGKLVRNARTVVPPPA